MTDRPILFSAPMVRALLREAAAPGTGKTETRRALRDQPVAGARFAGVERDGSWLFTQGCFYSKIRAPYAIDDRLWVRETVACGACAPSKPSHWPPSFWRREQGSPANPNGLWYRADGLDPERPITGRGKWVPGIHMPRWASRMTLRVTEVRVQRLQDVTDEDAIAEGILRDPATGSWLGAPGAGVGGATRLYVIPIHAFRDLWESLHGPDAWKADPWVSAVSFSVHRCNIDSMPVDASGAAP